MSTQSTVLPLNWQVPDVFRERLGNGPGRQRTMQADGHLLLITHLPPSAGRSVRSGRYFWRDTSGEWQSSDLGKGHNALTKHLNEYADAIAKLTKLENDAQSSEDYFQVISQLSPLLRATRNLHKTMQAAREASGNDKLMINLRDLAYELERDAELLFSEANHELDFLIAKRTEQQAASAHQMAVSAHRLNILAAFFFPMVTLATIFGTQLRHGYETIMSPYPFLGMIAVGLILGLALNAFVNVQASSKGTSKGTNRKHLNEKRPNAIS